MTTTVYLSFLSVALPAVAAAFTASFVAAASTASFVATAFTVYSVAATFTSSAYFASFSSFFSSITSTTSACNRSSALKFHRRIRRDEGDI